MKPFSGQNMMVAWVKYQRRAESLARYYQLDLRYYYYPWEDRSLAHKVVAYGRKFLNTYRDLRRQRPAVVFVQLAPTFALYATALYCRQTGARFVSDCHNTMLYDGFWVKMPGAKTLLRQSALALIHNEDLMRYSDQLALPGVILRDPIPRIAVDPTVRTVAGLAIQELTYVIIPCSYAEDEPIEPMFEAIRATPTVTFVATSHANKMPKAVRESLPANVTLTGFLEETEFNALYAHASAALVLTTREGTQPSGASEAIALGVPLVVSDIYTTRRLYGSIAVFVQNDQASIAAGIQQALGQRSALHEKTVRLRQEMDAANQAQLSAVAEAVGIAVRPPAWPQPVER